MSVGNSRYLNIGMDGRHCNCCFPAPGSKDRRAEFRRAKRRADRAAMKEAKNDWLDHQEMMAETIAKEYEDAYGDDPFIFADYYDDYDLRLQEEDKDAANSWGIDWPDDFNPLDYDEYHSDWGRF